LNLNTRPVERKQLFLFLLVVVEFFKRDRLRELKAEAQAAMKGCRGEPDTRYIQRKDAFLLSFLT